MCSRVDTRSKILTLGEAQRLPGPVILVTGYFDVLRAGHARELQQVRNQTPGRPLLVAVLIHAGELLDGAARAELVAALRMVDYVVTANYDEVDQLIERLRPADLVRLEMADRDRTQRLIEDAQRSHKR